MKSYMERKYYLRGLGIGIAVTAVIMGIAMPKNQTMTDEEVIARAKELGMVENTLLSDSFKDEQSEESADDGTGDSAAGDESIGTAGEKNTDNSAVEDSVIDGDGAEDDKKTEADKTGADINGQSVEISVEGKEQEAENQDAVNGQETIGTADETEQDKLPGKETAGDSTAESDKTDKNEDITSAAIKTITVTSGDGSYTVAKKLADVGVVTSAENFDSYLCQNGYDKKLRTGTFSIPADASDEQIARIVTGAE